MYTTARLCRCPGKTIHAYLQGRRDRLTNPMRFLIMACAIVTAAFVFGMPRSDFMAEGAFPDVDRSWETVPPEIMEKVKAAQVILGAIAEESKDRFLQKNSQRALAALNQSMMQQVGELSLTWMNVILLLALPANALISWLFFRRAKLNLAEHFAANAYVLGIQNLASVVLVPLTLLNWVDLNVGTGVYMLIGFIYQFVAWKQVFSLRGFLQCTIGFVALLLSVFGFLVLQGVATVFIYAYAS